MFYIWDLLIQNEKFTHFISHYAFFLMFIRVVHSRNCDSVSQNSKHKQRVCCFCQNPTHLLRNKNSAQKNKTCPLSSKQVPSTKTVHTDITWCLLADHHTNTDGINIKQYHQKCSCMFWFGEVTLRIQMILCTYMQKKDNKKVPI